MLYLLMAILSSATIFVLFKSFSKFSVHPFQAIVINYFTAGTLALLAFYPQQGFFALLSVPAIIWILSIGVLFFLNFLLIEFSTKHIGMATTSIACKISVVIPIIFSIIYDKELVTLTKLIGIVGAVISIVLLSKRKKEQENQQYSRWLLYLLPLILFMGLGITDSMVKYVQQTEASSIDSGLLTALLFSASFFSSLLWGLYKNGLFNKMKHKATLLGGFALGLANFGSIYFLIQSLKFSGLDNSIVFGIINLGIILLSVLVGFIIFKENLLKINWLGVAVAFVSLVLLMWMNG